ncbi:MAG: hypothetical protein AABX38_01890 [Candidatus Micrarchaeota archaeon]
MSFGKSAYLKKLTSKMQFRSVEVGEKLEGTSPPSVFIGSFGYPKVYVGPMMSNEYGDTSILDAPEHWISNNKKIEDIVQFRLNLVRGKSTVSINDLKNKLVNNLQEISLAKNSVESEAEFHSKPKGFTFNDDHAPFGPSAALDKFDIGNVKFEHNLEKAHYDTDLRSKEAVIDLFKNKVDFSQIQKALSTGSFGLEKNRKLVPTRWSITAADSILADHFLAQVRHNPTIETYRVYEFSALNNYFAILLVPTAWQYEWMESFIHVMDKEEVIFSDYETNRPKKEYSSVGGCYYSVKMEVCKKLAQEKKQAGAIVFREAWQGYIPTGVWLCRMETMHALETKPKEFYDLGSATNYIKSKLKLPFSRFKAQSVLLKELNVQRKLSSYF